jgi:hypothetical protein
MRMGALVAADCSLPFDAGAGAAGLGWTARVACCPERTIRTGSCMVIKQDSQS